MMICNDNYYCKSATALLLLMAIASPDSVVSDRIRIGDREKMGGPSRGGKDNNNIKKRLRSTTRHLVEPPTEEDVEWIEPDPEDLEIPSLTDPSASFQLPTSSPTKDPFANVPQEDQIPSNNNGSGSSAFNGRPVILVPQCELSTRPRNNFMADKVTDCANKVSYCNRDGSTSPWRYDEAEIMIQECFKTCVETLSGGVDEFCSLDTVPPQQPPAMPYCRSEGQDQLWTSNMKQNEQDLLSLLNVWRSQGLQCPEQYFDPVPPVIRNQQLDCAARAQAKKIVDYANANNGFDNGSPSLHRVCDGSNCDTFDQRMESAGYVDWMGQINEVAVYNYETPVSALQGWQASRSGHCPVLMKQDWDQVQVEVGIGFFKDNGTGRSSYVMVAGQR